MKKNNTSMSAGYVVDCTIVAKDVATLSTTLRTLTELGLCGCKITAHQSYKIDEMVKARNALLLAFGIDDAMKRVKSEATVTADSYPITFVDPEEFTSLDEVDSEGMNEDLQKEEDFEESDPDQSEEKESDPNDSKSN